MLDIMDYITLRKDITFAERGFQEIDALIFSELAYVDWHNIAEGEILLPDACEQFFQENAGTDFALTYAYSTRIPQLVRLLSDTRRYAQVRLMRYQSVFDETQEIQFAAVTMQLPDGSLFLAFRGTDSSIIGWKEDMKLTYLDEVPSQNLAWKYARDIYERYCVRKGLFRRRQQLAVPLYLGGHSKGGNLAMYVAIREQTIQSAITCVYNFDGPGFRPSFYERYDCTTILDRIHTYVPKDTIIGRLLSHREGVTVIDARENGLSQHDAFNWSVEADGFVTVSGWSEESDRIQQTIDEILMSKEDDQRKAYIDLIFHVLDRLEIRQISDFNSMGWRQGLNGIRELGSMSARDRKFLMDVIGFLWTQSKSVFLRPHAG